MMKTVVITDCKYRMSIPAVRALGRAGFRVVGLQTAAEQEGMIPAFSSRYMAEGRILGGSVQDAEYKDRLMALLQEYDRPILLCIGAATLNIVSAHREEFQKVCDCLVAPPSALDGLNDKEAVQKRAEELGILTPRRFEGEPEAYPVVIKPHCGEKLGLSAAERYAIAENREEFSEKFEKIKEYDPAPLVQQKVEGDGFGAALLLDRAGRLVRAVCHRRIREYPISGGPSTCCISLYDEGKIDAAYRLLSSFGFCGLAMVEFKGDAVLEVNPRIWGSFPMTECCGSDFIEAYARVAAGEENAYCPADFRQGVRMRFLLNDSISLINHLSKGHFGKVAEGIADCVRAKEALWDPKDKKPFFNYLRKSLINR